MAKEFLIREAYLGRADLLLQLTGADLRPHDLLLAQLQLDFLADRMLLRICKNQVTYYGSF